MNSIFGSWPRPRSTTIGRGHPAVTARRNDFSACVCPLSLSSQARGTAAFRFVDIFSDTYLDTPNRAAGTSANARAETTNPSSFPAIRSNPFGTDLPGAAALGQVSEVQKGSTTSSAFWHGHTPGFRAALCARVSAAKERHASDRARDRAREIAHMCSSRALLRSGRLGHAPTRPTATTQPNRNNTPKKNMPPKERRKATATSSKQQATSSNNKTTERKK